MRNGDAIKLPDNLRAWAQAQAMAGGFQDVEEYVSQVLREERKRLSQEVLELKLMKSLKSGPPRPVTEADWDSVKELARKAARKKSSHATRR